ncbi:MAG: cell division protein FtsX [Thermobacillus sp. ZCTH02-B1]|uniref:permease-like cell division protein FtsX n=1 Tax=Thermobacillus sp. ZCTH02-B1 TaxID=1858795 RepID=UPI000B56A6B8|nr:permease-like cell division protein FtsX [Thermobacillus sp. ZCTH02-B1]OUM94994.1 MAG: cell division protein FtsX [Thermobacillus sp. ZCTH02-B1]
MKFSTLLRHLREGSLSVVRNGWMSFASISSIAISLFILGVFLLLTLNVNNLTKQIENQVQIRVFLSLDISREKIEAIGRSIGALPEVSRIRFVSKAEGLEILRRNLGEDGQGILDEYDDTNNPLPDSYTVEVVDPERIAEVAAKIRAIGDADPDRPIRSVRYGQGTVEMLFRVTNAVRNVGLVIVLGLAFTATLLISNTIRITIFARRREIGIMKLVGATNSFIRWPFFVEGALLGFIGSAVTTAVLLAAYNWLVQSLQLEFGLMMIRLVTVRESGLLVAGVLIGIGTLIGIWGSAISVRKYLKV